MRLHNVLLVAGAASFSTRDVWDGYQKGLTEIGVNVIPYPTFSMLRVISPDLIGNDIIGKAVDHRNSIDAVIFIDGLYFRGRRQWVPKTLTDLGMPTILITTDDPYDEIEEAASLYSMQFTNEICSASRVVRYLPTAATQAPDLPPGRKFDVVFIGTIFEERVPTLQRLAAYCEANRIKCLIAGNMTDGLSDLQDLDCVTVKNEVIGSDAKWRLYRSAKVVLNVFRDADKSTESANPRVFEVTSMGAPALLTGPPRREVSRIFGESVYHFDDDDSLLAQLQSALDDGEERVRRVDEAKRITEAGHLYSHRAQQLVTACRSTQRTEEQPFPAEDKTCWIFGCGRTGSTWLGQMLGEVAGVRSWHEPMFGKLFTFIEGKQEEHDRAQSLFHSATAPTWLNGMRETFNALSRERFPAGSAESRLVVKDVNAPAVCPYLRNVFPESRYILLVRDPYDVLDSYLDMQRPGGWNEGYSGASDLAGQATVSCQNIYRSLKLSIKGFDSFPDHQRLLLRYEELLEEPCEALRRCAELMGISLSKSEGESIAARHQFENHVETGRLKHRRFGRAGVWKESENFTPQVRQIAGEILGGMRTRLEYSD